MSDNNVYTFLLDFEKKKQTETPFEICFDPFATSHCILDSGDSAILWDPCRTHKESFFGADIYHLRQVRGYTSFRAVTPTGRTNGWASAGRLLVVLGPGSHPSEQVPASGAASSAALELAQASSAPSSAVALVDLACSSASLCTSMWTPSTSRESSSMFCCCSKSGRTRGRLRSMSSVSWPAGTLGSPCVNGRSRS